MKREITAFMPPVTCSYNIRFLFVAIKQILNTFTKEIKEKEEPCKNRKFRIGKP